MQLPPARAGTFIRASLPRPSTSCRGTMARLATDAIKARMKSQWISRPSPFRYSRANACSASTSASLRVVSPTPAVHHPTVVSLSWVPV